jgi:hypothetical protein
MCDCETYKETLRAEVILPVLKEAWKLMCPLHVSHAITFT